MGIYMRIGVLAFVAGVMCFSNSAYGEETVLFTEDNVAEQAAKLKYDWVRQHHIAQEWESLCSSEVELYKKTLAANGMTPVWGGPASKFDREFVDIVVGGELAFFKRCVGQALASQQFVPPAQ